MTETALEQRPATQLRWSSMHCERLTIYQAENAPARSRTETEERRLWRGTRIGRDYADLLAEKYGEAALEREKKIQWAFGVGHADIYIIPERHIVECLSSASAGSVMRERKLLQMIGYMEGVPEAERGSLVVIDPSTFDLDITTVLRSSAAYRELAEQVAERIDRVRAYYATGQLPERVCRKPSDAIGHFCLHSDFCFQGWEPDALPLIEDADAHLDATAWYRVKQKRKAIGDEDKQLEKEQREIEARLADRIDAPGDYDLGQLRVRRIDVTRGPTIDARKVELAGLSIPEEAWKAGSSHTRWEITRTSDEPLAGESTASFGEVPF